MSQSFLYATCRLGSEPALKREVAARHKSLLTPAFMRPQLITWKAQETLPADFRLGAMFAHVAGHSLGMAETVAEVVAYYQALPSPPQALHVFPRDVPEAGVSEETWGSVDALALELQQALALSEGGKLRAGDTVMDVIVGLDGESMLVGLHRHQAGDFQEPGGLTRLSLPPEAPSNAWLKMEQALNWLDLEKDLQGLTVLELGSAPGGTTLSLLNRGAIVYGVDTAAMDERLLAHPQFHHLRVTAGDLDSELLPDQVDLLVCDMNLEPRLVCQYVEKISPTMRPLGLLLILKVNSPKVEAELPSLIQRVRRWAPGPLHVRQLPANRREVTLISWQAS